eukprot:gene25312-27446_t
MEAILETTEIDISSRFNCDAERSLFAGKENKEEEENVVAFLEAQYTTPVQHRSERFRSRLSISPHEYEEIQFFSASSPAVPTTTPPASVQKVKVSPAKCPFTPSAVQNFPGLDEWLQAIPPKKSKKVKKKTKTEKIDNNNNSSEGGLKHTSDSVTYLTEAPRAPSPKWQPRRRTTGMDRTDGGAVGGTAASLSDNVEMLSMSNHNEEEEEEEDAETDGEDEEDEADYEEDGEFRWSIDDLAQLMPVDIEVDAAQYATPSRQLRSPGAQHRYELAAEQQQAEIEQFFHHSNRIIPSPWVGRHSSSASTPSTQHQHQHQHQHQQQQHPQMHLLSTL